jgi:hypothetical protein
LALLMLFGMSGACDDGRLTAGGGEPLC